MKFKDFKQKIKNENYNIPDVLPKVQTLAYQKSFEPKTAPTVTSKNLHRHLALKLCSGILVIALIATFAIVGISKQFTNRVSIQTSEIKTVDSGENLDKILLSTAKYSTVKRTIAERIEDFLDSFSGCSKKAMSDGIAGMETNTGLPNSPNGIIPNKGTTGNPATPDKYDTIPIENNNQVKGVNEPDIVKVDGSHIYHYSNQHLYIYEIGTTNRLVREYEWNFNECQNANLQQTSKYLILYFENPQTQDTNILIYDKFDGYNLAKTINVSGKIVDSRLIENTLYMITQYVISKDNLPQYKVDKELSLIAFNNIAYISNADNSQYTLVSTINLENTITIDVQAQLGAVKWNVVYCNPNRIYLASSIYNGQRRVIETTIYMYNITKNDASLDAFVQTDGQIPDQYSMDEYDGYLRIATINVYHKDPTKYNSVKVFNIKQIEDNKAIPLVGELNEGLGLINQTIRAARFNGTHAQVVTYYQSDPLYDIDLSDPTKPTIISAYEAPGYSTYLHAFNDKTTLGIGYINNNFNPKLSLYQINDQGVSQQIGKDLILENLISDYYSAYLNKYIQYAFEKPRELLCINEKMIIGIPVSIEGYDRTLDYWIFEIDPSISTPINLIKVISAEEITNQEFYEAYSNILYQEYAVQRVVYLNNYYYALLDGRMMIYDSDLNYLDYISNEGPVKNSVEK